MEKDREMPRCHYSRSRTNEEGNEGKARVCDTGTALASVTSRATGSLAAWKRFAQKKGKSRPTLRLPARLLEIRFEGPPKDSKDGETRNRENVLQLHFAGTYILGIIIFCGGEEAKRKADEEPRGNNRTLSSYIKRIHANYTFKVEKMYEQQRVLLVTQLVNYKQR
ncbi:hypothetical protein EAG_11132 [Camponotus floridanus]|uniref:Uncharacterized protein n=1 Tax=Camponotus floridanus TaxID=104421 RepID=E2A883_CAMFO|nr:hypothetical protein EAG_11132 [Camponotus floridanus]